MPAEIYVRLREKLDSLGFGYSATESGIEYVCLEKFFTPSQAEAFINLDIERYLTAAQVAERMAEPEEKIAAELAEMARDGLCFKTSDEDGNPLYRAIPFAHGIYEFHLTQIEDDWSKALSKHYLQGWGKDFYKAKTPLMRTIPIHKKIESKSCVLPADRIENLIRDKRRYAVANCICRLREVKRGKPCGHDLETCLSFDRFADLYIENGWGREIDFDECMRIIWKAHRDGMVIQVSNAEDVEVLCCCCGDACGMLGAMKYFPGPGVQNVGKYLCRRDAEKCLDSCTHVCAKRCPVWAFKDDDQGQLVFKPQKCIGCGVCIDTCPGRALELVAKDLSEMPPEPEDFFGTYMQMADEIKDDRRRALAQSPE